MTEAGKDIPETARRYGAEVRWALDAWGGIPGITELARKPKPGQERQRLTAIYRSASKALRYSEGRDEDDIKGIRHDAARVLHALEMGRLERHVRPVILALAGDPVDEPIQAWLEDDALLDAVVRHVVLSMRDGSALEEFEDAAT